MDQPISTTGNCGIVNAYPAWITTNGQRVVAPTSALPSIFNSPSDPWTLIASSFFAGNPPSAGTSGCFICLRLYGSPSAEANTKNGKLFPQPYVQGYVHDSEDNSVLAVDDPNWFVNTPGVWRAVDCPVGNNKVYYQSSCSQAGKFTKLWILGTTIPITALSISQDGVTWEVASQNTADAGWIQQSIEWSRTTFPQTVHLKMTSLLGQVLTDTFQWTGIKDGTCGASSQTMQPDMVAIQGNVQFNGFSASTGSGSGSGSSSPAVSLRWNLNLVFAVVCAIACLMVFM